MAMKKNKHSVAKILNKKGRVIGYLSTKDEENGLDSHYDMLGYTVVPL